jgi:hypothetical protein
MSCGKVETRDKNIDADGFDELFDTIDPALAKLEVAPQPPGVKPKFSVLIMSAA